MRREEVSLVLLWLLCALVAIIAMQAVPSSEVEAEIATLVGAPATPCTFNSAIAELDAIGFPGMWWAEAAEVKAPGAADLYFRFTVGDYPNLDDRWMIDGPDLDIAACMAVERVKQLEARR